MRRLADESLPAALVAADIRSRERKWLGIVGLASVLAVKLDRWYWYAILLTFFFENRYPGFVPLLDFDQDFCPGEGNSRLKAGQNTNDFASPFSHGLRIDFALQV